MLIHGQFVNLKEVEYSVFIYSSEYSTVDIEICPGSDVVFAADAIEIITEGTADVFQPIIKHSATINLLTKSYLGDYLFGDNARDIHVLIYREEECIFAGYVEPNIYTQTYTDVYDMLTLNCNDVLSTLQYYNYGDIVNNYDDYKASADNKTFADIIKNMLVTDLDFINETVSGIYYDQSRKLTSETGYSDVIFDDLQISELLFLDEDEDSVWSNEEVLFEVLQYLNLHIVQLGLNYYIFDWEMFNKIDKEGLEFIDIVSGEDTVSKTIVTSVSSPYVLAQGHYGSDDTNLTIGDVFSKICITCELTEIEDIVNSPFEEESLVSPYTNKNFVWKESYLINEEPTQNCYFQYMQNKFWTLRFWDKGQSKVRNVDELVQYDNNNIAINQYLLAYDSTLYKLFPMIFQYGHVDSYNAEDNKLISKVSMDTYISITVNGKHTDDPTVNQQTINELNNIMSKTDGIIEFNSNITGGAFSPADDSITNFIVFDGTILLQATQILFNPWQDIGRISCQWFAPMDPAVNPVYPGDVPPYNVNITGLPIPVNHKELIDYLRELLGTEDGDKFYYRDEKDIDKVSKVPVLLCQMKIGDKYCVEVDSPEGSVLETEFVWLESDGVDSFGLPTATYNGHVYACSFTIGVNPKIGDYLLQTEFSFQNTLTIDNNIDAEGTAVPIKKSDALSGNLTFKILGVADAKWKQQLCHHPSFWRHSKWWTEELPLMEYVQTVFIKNFTCKLYSDNAGNNVFDSQDLIYMSTDNGQFINKKDDITFRINTALTAKECVEKHIANKVRMSNPVLSSDKLPITEIKSYSTPYKDVVIGKSEELYIDEYYRYLSKQRLYIETSVNYLYMNNLSQFDIYGSLTKINSMNKVFRIVGIDFVSETETKKLVLREIDNEEVEPEYTFWTVSGEATNCEVTGYGEYREGQTCTLSVEYEEGYNFIGWSDGSTETTRSFVVTRDIVLNCSCEIKKYMIYGEGVHCEVTGYGEYEYGQTCTLTAIPDDDYYFTSWHDGNTDNPRIFEVYRSQNINTTCNAIGEPLTVSGEATNCTVTGYGEYQYMETCTLTAEPNFGYEFTAWSDGNTDNPRSFVVNRNIVINCTCQVPAYGDPLCFTAEQAKSYIKLTFHNVYSDPQRHFEYSTDGINWTAYTPSTYSTYISLTNIGDKIYFRNNNQSKGLSTSSNYYYQFVMAGKIAASGSVMYMLSKDASYPLQSYCFYRLFYGCTSLTTAPELPATALTSYCYSYMFSGCTGLTTAPELPATTLANYCYQYMFSGCTNLSFVKCLATTNINETNCNSWLKNVSSAGMFICADGCMSIWSRGSSGIPTGWNIYEESEKLFILDNSLVQTLDTEASTHTITYMSRNIEANELTYTCDDNWVHATFDNTNKVITVSLDAYEGSEDYRKTKVIFGIINDDSFNTTVYVYQGNNILCFTAEEAKSYIKLNKVGSVTQRYFEYSTDGINWTAYTPSTDSSVITLTNIGDKVYFRNDDQSKGLSTNSSNYYKFVMTGKIAVSGSVMYMLSKDASYPLQPYSLYYLFNGCTSLTAAPELPATTLANYCYEFMFYGCTGLTTAPELPATTLAICCYSDMFSNCTVLTETPELPATTLANSCYWGMFYGCTGLATAPVLPATTLADRCYAFMFRDCRGLTTAPELPATTLANSCYYSMFSGCSSLATAPELPATTLANYCYGFMFDGCTSLTTAPELPATTLRDDCYYGMFYNCTGLTTAPELPATTLASSCYESMFEGCTSLTTAPELPATTLNNYCYAYMFRHCTKLNYVKCLATTNINKSSSIYYWLDNVSSTGTFICAAGTISLWTRDQDGIPSGWTVIEATD